MMVSHTVCNAKPNTYDRSVSCYCVSNYNTHGTQYRIFFRRKKKKSCLFWFNFQSTIQQLYCSRGKTKHSDNSDELKTAMDSVNVFILCFPSHLSFVQIQCILKASIQPTIIIYCSMLSTILHFPRIENARSK